MNEEQLREKRAALSDLAISRARRLAEQYRAMGRDMSAIGEAFLQAKVYEELLKKAGLQ